MNGTPQDSAQVSNPVNATQMLAWSITAVGRLICRGVGA